MNNYNFTDDVSSVKAAAVYYRLQMVDKDGKFTTSKIVSVLVNGNQLQFSIKPNPATNYFVVSPNASLNANTLVTITDFAGRVVMKQTIVLNGDKTINISSLQKGVYMVKITTGDSNTSTQKLVVQ